MKEELFNKLVKKTLECLAIDSVQSEPCAASPFGEGVSNCIKYTLDLAHRIGFSTFNNQGYYGTAEIGEGETFGILGHLDTVPYDNNWKHNPLGELTADRIYGRGIMDDKGPMLSCLFAVYSLLLEGKTPKRKIKFIFGGNEESGWGCIEKFLECDVMPKIGFTPDGDFPVINCEKGIVHYKLTFKKPCELLFIKGGSRVNIVMEECEASLSTKLNTRSINAKFNKVRCSRTGDITKIKAFGKSAHGSHPEKGDNAFRNLLESLAFSFSDSHPFSSLYKMFSDYHGEGLNINLSDDKSGALTMNIGLVYLENDKLIIEIDIRFPVSYSEERIQDLIQTSCKDLLSIEKTGGHDPLYINAENELIKSLLSAYSLVTGEKASPLSIGGGTYARAMPCGVAFGPIFPHMESTIHERDEYVTLDDFHKMTDVYYEAIKELCF